MYGDDLLRCVPEQARCPQVVGQHMPTIRQSVRQPTIDDHGPIVADRQTEAEVRVL